MVSIGLGVVVSLQFHRQRSCLPPEVGSVPVRLPPRVGTSCLRLSVIGKYNHEKPDKMWKLITTRLINNRLFTSEI